MESINCLLSPLSSAASKRPLCPSCLPQALSNTQTYSFQFYTQRMECFRGKSQCYANRIPYKIHSIETHLSPRLGSDFLICIFLLLSYSSFLDIDQTDERSVCVCVCVCVSNKENTMASSLLMTWVPSYLRPLRPSPLFLLPNSRSHFALGKWLSTLATLELSRAL